MLRKIFAYLLSSSNPPAGESYRPSPSLCPAPPPSTAVAKSEKVQIMAVLEPNPTSPDSYYVRAQASYTSETNGTKKYATEIHKGATILDILQVQSAVSWHEKIDQRALTEQQALSWLVEADRITGRHYLSLRYLDSPSSELFYSALARHCLHYVLGHLDDPALPDNIRTLYDIQIEGGPGKMRFARDIEEAKSWVTLEASGALDSKFVQEVRNTLWVYADRKTQR
jgi:hypothetical protein